MTRNLRFLQLAALALLPLALCPACSEKAGQAADIGRAGEPAAAPELESVPAAQAEVVPAPRPAAPPAPEPLPEPLPKSLPEPLPESSPEQLSAALPHVVIDAPADMSVYGPTVLVAGRVSDSEQSPGSIAGLKDLTWVIPGSDRGGHIDFREDGSFDFHYSTWGFTGHHFLSVRAQSLQNRFFEKVIALLDSGRYPALEVTSPADGSFYDGDIPVAGSAGGPQERPESVYWTLSGSDRRGRSAVAPDGSFGFTVPAAGLMGDRTLTLRVVNREGRSAEASITLRGPAAARAEAPAEVPSEAPVIVLAVPAEGSSYDRSVVVEGYLRPAGTVRSLSYRLYGDEAGSGEDAGEAAFDPVSGVFSFELDTRELSGPRTLELAAVGHDGQTARTAVRMEEGIQGPVIELTVPENNSFYRSAVSIVGRVGNSREDAERADQVISLSCRLGSDPARSGELEFDPKNGVFSADFSTAGLEGRQSLEFSAENSRGQRSRRTLTLRDGNLSPELAIHYPPAGDAYGAWVAVRGRLSGTGGGALPVEAVRSLSYVVASAESFDPDTELRGGISLAPDGGFQFLFPGRGLSGPQQVTVRAEAVNGNFSETSLTLVQGEGDFPSFRADSGDRRVTLSWDPLPLTAAYTLSYTSDGPGTGSRRLEKVTPPVVVGDLENGRLYTFELSAAAAEQNEVYASSPRQSIPLSPDTLAPDVRGEYERILVSWPAIPGSRSYELWRGVDDPEDLALLAEVDGETGYEDTGVLYGKTYSYAVKPALPGSSLSRAASGQTLPFPVQKLISSGLNPNVRALAVAAKGAYVFLAGGGEGLSVVDVADPSRPQTVATLATFDARDVDCAGEYVYVADGEKGLKVIDVSEPSRPQQVGFRATFAARGVRVRGDFAYVADGEKGLKVIDISEPRYPLRVASLETEDARGVALQGARLYIADGDGGLKVADIGDSAQPRLIGAFPLPDVRAVAVAGNSACVAAGRGVVILDVSDPAYMRTTGTYAAPDVLDVALRGKYLFLADRQAGITVIDVGDPGRPVKFAALKSDGAVGLAVSDEFAYVARESGLQVVSVRIEGKSRQLAAVETEGRAYGLDLSGGYAYVADHQQGLHVIDISRPAEVGPSSLTGSCDTEYARDVAVREYYAYVSDGPRGLKIVDCRSAWDGDPATQPRVVGSYDSEGNARGLALEENRLFLADGEAGLQILDISEAGHPVWLAEDGGPEARDVLVRQGRAFVIGSEGLRVLDAADPERLRLLGSFDTGAGSRLALSGSSLYAVAASGLWILDVTDPARIKPLGFHASRSAEDVFIAGGYAYLAEGFDGLTVLDVRDPGRLQRVSACGEVYAVGVAVRDRYAFVVDSTGLKVLDILIPPWLKK